MPPANPAYLAQLAEHPPDLLVLTHAHLDHIGALPIIKRRFPKLPVYATRATRRLALEVLSDAVKVGESQGVSLYTLGEAVEAVAQTLPITPAEPLAFPGGQLTPYPAGHLLGAVGLLLETAEGSLFHTGDFSNLAGLTTEPAYRPPTPVAVAAVVSEATYGDTALPNRKQQVRCHPALPGPPTWPSWAGSESPGLPAGFCVIGCVDSPILLLSI